MMIKPLNVKVDLAANAGYVSYSNNMVAGTIDVWENGHVAADVDANGDIVGIEVLGFDSETLEHARSFAEQRGLSFPSHLEGALVPA